MQANRPIVRPLLAPTRRQFLVGGAAAGALGALPRVGARGVRAMGMLGAASASGAAAQAAVAARGGAARRAAEIGAAPGLIERPTLTPDGATLASKVIEGARVFHLIAEPVTHEFAPGLVGECWGYNGRVHGPTIEAVAGERVRIYVTNRLPVATTVHWHGVAVPNGMDGVGGLSQRAIEPGETFKYEFTLPRAGTFMYHSHHDEMTQMAMGLMGMLVVHPREPEPAPVDHDFVYLLSEWKIDPGERRPDPNEMTDFNVLTLNARIFPGTQPLLVRRGSRVRIRIGNLSAMDHHPIHLHGHHFTVTETDGGTVPESARFPETSVLVPVGAVRVIELVADNPGDWALHCHMTHHIMNQMGHDIPNLIGVDPGEFDEQLARAVPAYETLGESSGAPAGHAMGDSGTIPRNSLPMMGGAGPHGFITMGGMFSILKVRDDPDRDATGWYANDPGTQADAATPEDLARDGIPY